VAGIDILAAAAGGRRMPRDAGFDAGAGMGTGAAAGGG
jgi:hypothetical protein